jgi:hypothetical protein
VKKSIILGNAGRKLVPITVVAQRIDTNLADEPGEKAVDKAVALIQRFEYTKPKLTAVASTALRMELRADIRNRD